MIVSDFKIVDSHLHWNHDRYLNLISAIKFGADNYLDEEVSYAEGRIVDLELPEEDASDPGDEEKRTLVQLLWLRDSISILEETGRKFFDKPFALHELVRKYWELASENRVAKIEYKQKGEDGKEKISAFVFYEDALRRYLELCMDERQYEWFKQENIDREKAVKELVYENVEERKVRDVLKRRKTDAGRKDVIGKKIRKWYLANYDLDHLRKFGSQFEGDDTRLLPYFVYEFLWALFPLLGVVSIYFLDHLGGWVAFLSGIEPLLDWGVIVLSLAILYFKFLEREGSLLRLFGCILAGYIAIGSDESWCGILNASDPNDLLKLAARWALFGSFTWIYLKREIGNKIEKSKIESNLRTATIRKTGGFFLRTLSYSFIVGIFFSFLNSMTMMTRNEGELKTLLFDNPSLRTTAYDALPNFAGIFPDVVLSQAPMAMFIGIFINLLWEDKSLTEPL